MVQDRTPEETFRWAANSPWGQRVTDLAHSESACPPSRPRIHPLEKLSWRRVGRGAPGASGRLSTPAGFLGSHSLGYREIFISRRWAPAAPEAEHAATIRKPSHPRDKDRSVTHRDPAWQGRPQATWPSAEKPPRPPPARGRGLCCRPRGMRAEDGDGRTHREKHRGGEKGSVLTPRRLLRIRTYPCFTMSLKLEAILDGRDPPRPGARTRSGSGAGSGPGRERTWGEKVDAAKRLRRRLGAALEGAHHFVCPPNPESGRPARSHFGGARGARRGGERLGRRRQLTHPPACREEERRLLRAPALPLPGAWEEGGGEEEEGGKEEGEGRRRRRRERDAKEDRGGVGAPPGGGAARVPAPGRGHPRADTPWARRTPPLLSRPPGPTRFPFRSPPSSRTPSAPQPAPAPRGQPGGSTRPLFSLRCLIFGGEEIPLYHSHRPPRLSAPSLSREGLIFCWAGGGVAMVCPDLGIGGERYCLTLSYRKSFLRFPWHPGDIICYIFLVWACLSRPNVSFPGANPWPH